MIEDIKDPEFIEMIAGLGFAITEEGMNMDIGEPTVDWRAIKWTIEQDQYAGPMLPLTEFPRPRVAIQTDQGWREIVIAAVGDPPLRSTVVSGK